MLLEHQRKYKGVKRMSYNVGQFRKDMLDGTNSRLLNKINI